MISVVFPGQGSQKVGMGSDLYNKFQSTKELFKRADEILGYKISNLILSGPQEKLNQTTFTQPAIYLISYAICEILKKETEFFQNKFNFFAGHSLGEYTALTAADAITFEQGLVLLKNRGEAMQSAVSAPFHCELMRKATLKMENLINDQELKDPKIKVVSNVTAEAYKNVDEIKQLLIKQIESPVRWRETIQNMIEKGTNTFVELGPGKVLSGLIKRINKEVKVLNIDTLEDIQDIDK